MPEPLPLVAQPDLESRVAAVVRDGYVYFPQVIGSAEIAELRRSMDSLTALPENYDRDWRPPEHSYVNKSINNVFNRSALFLQYLDRPGVIELAEALHGADCHVIGMTAWVTGPGRPAQRLHADWQPLVLPEEVMEDPRVQIPVYITTAHYYLDDITPDLGPTAFVPGSHRSGRPPGTEETNWRGREEQTILCAAGDVVVFRSEVWHRGTANTSNRERYLLQVHYGQRMISQRFPPYLNRFQFDPEILARCSPRQRRLLGDHPQGSYD
jgi:hypothetical protein